MAICRGYLFLVRLMRIELPLLLTFSVGFAFAKQPGETSVWQPPAGLKQLPIWPGPVPDARPFTGPETLKTNTEDFVAGKPWLVVENVSQPTITVFPPKGAKYWRRRRGFSRRWLLAPGHGS